MRYEARAGLGSVAGPKAKADTRARPQAQGRARVDQDRRAATGKAAVFGFAATAHPRDGSTMKKTKPSKAAPKKKKTPRKDASQVALSIVERVTGGKLK